MHACEGRRSQWERAELEIRGEALRAGDVKSHPKMNQRAHLGQLRGID